MQPYNSLPRMHPGEKILLRIANAGRELHPFHTHGNNTTLLARDGRVLESAPGAGPDLATSDFTIKTIPGETYDATFEWTGKGLGFDAYGHAPSDALAPNEYAPDHGKPFPVVLPNMLDMTFGSTTAAAPTWVASARCPRATPRSTRRRATSTCSTRTRKKSSPTTTYSPAA